MRKLNSIYIMVIGMFAIVMAQHKTFPTPQIEFNPEKYICYRASESLEIDGEINESDWQNAVRTKYFVDIEGSLKPRPRFWTYIKMLWDDDFLYIAAEIQEPHLWATIEERDAKIYEDNAFEVFIDPDGDSHAYYELEINAFGTFWDLFMTKPYRDDGKMISSWDIYGLKSAVSMKGTINDPSDIDSRWRVELAVPWNVLGETSYLTAPPQDGDYWRINFFRVVWPLEPKGGKYEKFKYRKTGKTASPLYWAWSPQGLVDTHYPEMWGYVYFSNTIAGEGTSKFELPASEKIKWVLRQVYYKEKEHYLNNKTYTSNLSDLKIDNQRNYQIQLATTMSLFESAITDTTTGLTWHIRNDGYIWKSQDK